MAAKKMVSQIREFKELIVLILFFLGVISCLAKGFVDKRIDIKMSPVVEALEFQNFLMMESLPDSVVNRATVRYTNSKRGSAK